MRVGEEALADRAGVSMWGSTGWEGKHTTCTESWTLARQVLPALASFVAVASVRIKKTRFFGLFAPSTERSRAEGKYQGKYHVSGARDDVCRRVGDVVLDHFQHLDALRVAE
jgi:hypothetical protein